MMKKIIVLGLALSAPAFSTTCTLPKGESIKVGCSYDCDFFYRFRVSMTAWGLGYSTKFVNLKNQPDMKTAMASVDGILVPGGADINPKYYLASVTPELREYTEKNIHLAKLTKETELRDSFEHKLLKAYDQDDTFKDLPLLGICRGFQMMSVAQTF
jgi:gamma-glutamyl-gamma-aminobutyrate hydrolase PuuD